MKISSAGQKIVVFSDIHQSIDRLQEILFKESNADYFISGDDIFDTHIPELNTDWNLERTCRVYESLVLGDKRYINLHSNHTITYLYGNPLTICGGYSERKDRIIQGCLNTSLKKIREKTLWYCWIDDFLVSHAGLHPSHLPPFIKTDRDSISNFLDKEAEKAEFHLKNNGTYWLYMAGRARGGLEKFGGLTWLDFNDEFEPIEGISQIMGHSSGDHIRPYHTEGSLNPNDWQNICIDCNLSQYLVIQDGKIEVKIT